MKLGPYTLRPIEMGSLRVDGGGMFGVVPKVLWSGFHPPDKDNRIAMVMRGLYVEGGGRRLVIDAGAGTKHDEKEGLIHSMKAIGLREALRGLGVDPASITDAVVSHLHFDHAGGFTVLDGGELRLALPNATHHVQRAQWETAVEPNDRDLYAFSADDFVPIEKAGRLNLLDGETEILPGVRVLPTKGHTPGHQLVLIETDDGALLYCADLIPLASQINLRWIMSYDEDPLSTLEEKKSLLARAAREGWILFFEHDPEVVAVRVREVPRRGFVVSETVEVGS
jgi:glyoxylase-like metal-dependent hydrolase (beta-lactamase superfamily II)